MRARIIGAGWLLIVTGSPRPVTEKLSVDRPVNLGIIRILTSFRASKLPRTLPKELKILSQTRPLELLDLVLAHTETYTHTFMSPHFFSLFGGCFGAPDHDIGDLHQNFSEKGRKDPTDMRTEITYREEATGECLFHVFDAPCVLDFLSDWRIFYDFFVFVFFRVPVPVLNIRYFHLPFVPSAPVPLSIAFPLPSPSHPSFRRRRRL